MDETSSGEERSKKRKGYIPIAAIGCGSLILLALVAAVAFVVLKTNAASDGGFLGSLAELFLAATSERSAMAQLKEDLASAYPAEKVGVHAGTRTILDSGRAYLSLDVEFVNPSFVTLPEASQTTEVARDIAIYVASKYPNVERFDVISITLLFKSGPVGTSATYRFDTSDLRRSNGAP